MAKWLKNYLSVGGRKLPPQPPKPDYSESEILKAYRAQRNLDFEDPYEESEGKSKAGSEAAPVSPLHHSKPSSSSSSSNTTTSSPSAIASSSPDIKYISPKHRLIKVDSNDISARAKVLSSEDNKHRQDATDDDYSDPFDTRHEARREANEKQEVENNGYMEPYEAQRVIVRKQTHVEQGNLPEVPPKKPKNRTWELWFARRALNTTLRNTTVIRSLCVFKFPNLGLEPTNLLTYGRAFDQLRQADTSRHVIVNCRVSFQASHNRNLFQSSLMNPGLSSSVIKLPRSQSP